MLLKLIIVRREKKCVVFIRIDCGVRISVVIMGGVI